MANDRRAKRVTRDAKVPLRSTEKELEDWHAAAGMRGVTFSEWARNVLNREAEREKRLAKEVA